MFKNAQGKFDGRIFIGVMLGLGTVGGGVIKMWASIGGDVPPFWLWAVPTAFILIGLLAWMERRRHRRELRARVARSGRIRRRNDINNGD